MAATGRRVFGTRAPMSSTSVGSEPRPTLRAPGTAARVDVRNVAAAALRPATRVAPTAVPNATATSGRSCHGRTPAGRVSGDGRFARKPHRESCRTDHCPVSQEADSVFGSVGRPSPAKASNEAQGKGDRRNLKREAARSALGEVRELGRSGECEQEAGRRHTSRMRARASRLIGERSWPRPPWRSRVQLWPPLRNAQPLDARPPRPRVSVQLRRGASQMILDLGQKPAPRYSVQAELTVEAIQVHLDGTAFHAGPARMSFTARVKVRHSSARSPRARLPFCVRR